VSRKHPRCRLAIIGDGLSRSHFELFARELGISDRVDLMGIQPRTNVAEILNRSRLFLLSSISEGMRKVLLEALACGTPVVCTNVGGCRDVVKNGGKLVVPSKNSEGSANAMDRVLSNPQLRRQFSMQGPQIAIAYDWRLIARKVEKYIPPLSYEPNTLVGRRFQAEERGRKDAKEVFAKCASYTV